MDLWQSTILKFVGTNLALSAPTGSAQTVDEVEQQLLEHLDRPLTAAQLQKRLAGAGWEPEALGEVPELLASLQSRGLAGDPRRLALTAGPLSGSAPHSGVPQSMGWLTCDRPEVLRQTLESWQKAIETSGVDRPRLVIVDDCRTLSEQTHEVVQKFAAGYGGETRFLERQDREALVDRVEARLRPHLEFALGLGGQFDGVFGTWGAASNALLLAQAGGVATIGDDDILPEFRTVVGVQDGLRLSSAPDPGRWVLLTGDEDYGVPVTDDVFRAHRSWLGQATAELLAAASEADVAELRSHTARRLALPSARVAALMFHYWGDSGMTDHRALIERPERFDPRALGDDRYDLVRTSRRVFRAPQRDTLGGTTCMGGHMAIDARTIVPPFSPLGRGLDGLWGGMLTLLDEGASLLCPREAIHHRPPGTRTGGDPGAWPLFQGINYVLIALLTDWANRHERTSLSYPLAGALLEDWGSGTATAQNALWSELTATHVAAARSRIERALASDLVLGRGWEADAQVALGGLDLPQSPPPGWSDYLRSFGQLVAVWPQVWEQVTRSHRPE